MKHLFIVNPAAGGKDSTDFVSAKVAQFFSGKEGDFEIYSTKAPMDAVRKIKYEANLCDELRVYACGGDGTLNECANGVFGFPNASVGVFPIGTGNDFIRTFGKEQELFRNIANLINGFVRPIDVISTGERIAVNICSVGIDARIGTDVHKYSRLPILGGSAAYVVSLAVNIFRGINSQMTIRVNGETHNRSFALVCACNGNFYGGGFNPVPEAMPDDGVLDMLHIKKVARNRLCRCSIPTLIWILRIS